MATKILKYQCKNIKIELLYVENAIVGLIDVQLKTHFHVTYLLFFIFEVNDVRIAEARMNPTGRLGRAKQEW